MSDNLRDHETTIFVPEDVGQEVLDELWNVIEVAVENWAEQHHPTREWDWFMAAHPSSHFTSRDAAVARAEVAEAALARVEALAAEWERRAERDAVQSSAPDRSDARKAFFVGRATAWGEAGREVRALSGDTPTEPTGDEPRRRCDAVDCPPEVYGGSRCPACPPTQDGDDRPPCGTCFRSGWHGSREGDDHRHCHCGAPCKACAPERSR